MKHIIFVFLLALANSSVVSKENEQPLKISAQYHDGGYHKLWTFNIRENPECDGGKVKFDHIGKARFAGSALLSADDITEIRLKVLGSAFFTLPATIYPEESDFHMEEYSLSICIRDKCHSVKLYGPRLIEKPSKNFEDYRIFMTAWNAVMKNTKVDNPPYLNYELISYEIKEKPDYDDY